MENISDLTSKIVGRKLNTKEFCFFCLKVREIKTESIIEIDADNLHQGNKSFSLRLLQRYLKIYPKNINGVSTRLFSNVEEEIKADFCSDCGSAIQRFSVLFQQLEKIQMEMDYQLERINLSISQGAESPDLVENYSKGMTSDAEALSELSFVDNFRKEISNKCYKARNGSIIAVIELNKIPEVDLNESVIIKEETVFWKDGQLILDNPPSSSPPLQLSVQPSSDPLSNPTSALIQNTIKEMDIRTITYCFKNTETDMYQCTKCKQSSKHYSSILWHYCNVHKCDICNQTCCTHLNRVVFGNVNF